MDYALTAFQIALSIKAMIDQSMQNSKEFSTLSKQLCGDCQDLEKKRRQLGDHSDPILDESLNRLASTLQRIYDLCQAALIKKPGKRNLLKYQFRSFFFSSDIRDQITAAKEEIRDARARFVEDGVWALNLQNASNKMLARKSEESLSEEGGEAYQGDGVVESPSEHKPAPACGFPTLTLIDEVVRKGIPVSMNRISSLHNYRYLDTVDLCFHSRMDENSIISSLNELLDESDQKTPVIEWINSAMLITPALFHLGMENGALSLASACCSLVEKYSEGLFRLNYDIALASCKANLSLLQHACGKRREAVTSADQAITVLDIARSRCALNTVSIPTQGGQMYELQRKRILYTHARLLALHSVERFEDAKKALDALFGADAAPDLRKLRELRLPHCHIGLLLLDRWRAYSKLQIQTISDTSLQSALGILCELDGGSDLVPVLQRFMDSSDMEARGYEDERLKVSMYIGDALVKLSSKRRALPEVVRAVSLLRSAVEGGKIEHEEAYGDHAMKLAFMLNEMGRTTSSIEATQEAASSRERLLKRQPNRRKYQMKLAQTCRKLGDWQRRNAQFKDSLTSIDRSVELLYHLTSKDKANSKYRDNFVKSLTSLSETEAGIDGYEDSARDHAFKALSIIDDPDGPQFLFDTKGTRAYTYYIIAKRLASTDMKEAYSYLESAMKQYEAVLEEKYVWFRAVEFALSCDKASELHLKRHNRRQALSYAEKAVQLDRELCKERPGLAWRLAAHLETNLECLMSRKNFREAATVVSELVATRRGIEIDDPTSEHRMDVARALDLQAKGLWKLGQLETAIGTQHEALAIAQTEADRFPDEFSCWLYIFKMHLSNLQHEKGDNEAALGSAQEGVTYVDAFASKRQDVATLEYLATGLQRVAARLIDLGKINQAVQKLQYAATICTQLVSRRPARYRPLLLEVWDEDQKQLIALGRRQEAIDVLQLSIDQRRKRGSGPRARADVASGLNQLSVQKAVLGRRKNFKEALEASEEAVQMMRRLIEEGKRKYDDLDFAIYFSNLGLRQADLKQRNARDTLLEASKRLNVHLISSPNSVRESYKSVQDRLKEFSP